MSRSTPTLVWILRSFAVLLLGAATFASYQASLGHHRAAVHAKLPITEASVAGSATTTARPIESIALGERVAGRNPLRDEVDESLADPVAQTWRAVRLTMRKESGQQLDIELLRPLEWIEASGAAPGKTIFLNLHEMAAVGDAVVDSIGPCPPIAAGHGSVVTGRFSHEPEGELLSVQLDSDVPPIVCTPNHPFWSEERQEFVRADELQAGEKLLTQHGPIALRALTEHPRTQRVYNLEVHREHVYHVGAQSVLVHNQCEHVFRSLSPDDILRIKSGQSIVARGTATGPKAMANYISSNTDSAYIAVTEEFKKLWDTQNFVKVDVSKLSPGSYTSKLQMKQSRQFMKKMDKPQYLDQQAHGLILRQIPLNAIDEIWIDGVRYIPE
jgi:hypothetical protein